MMNPVMRKHDSCIHVITVMYMRKQSGRSSMRGAPWPSGRASASGAKGRGFDPQSGRHVVSLSKIHLPPKKYR